MPTVADVERNPSDGNRARMPWEAPMHDVRTRGADFAPGGLNHRPEFWESVVLRGHPQKAQMLAHLKEGVSVFEVLTPDYRGSSRASPYRRDAFPGALFPNRIPKEHAGFVRSEVAALVTRGGLVKWADVPGPDGPTRPRLVLPLSVEPSKP